MKMVTAVQIAKEMKLTPKRVRSILRKQGMEHDGRWKFPASDKEKLKATIRAARKRATRKTPVAAKPAPRKRPVVSEHHAMH